LPSDWETQQEEIRAWREKAESLAKKLLKNNPKTTLSEFRNQVDKAGWDASFSATWWGERLLTAKAEMGLIVRKVKFAVDGRKKNDSCKSGLAIHMEYMRDIAEAATSVPVDPVVRAMDGAINLATSMLKLAYEDASMENLSDRAPSLRARYARAWLQDPDATALWCGLVGVDGDVVAERSRREHGRPVLTPEEIESIRERS